MSSFSNLIVIPCPNGRVGTTGKLSVVLVPRLREDGLLTDYPTWADWGTQVANLRFALYNGNNPIGPPPPPLTVTSPAVDPDMWRAMFGKNAAELSKVAVKRSTFVDRTQTSLTSMDVASLLRGMSTVFTSLARLGAGVATKGAVAGSGVAVDSLSSAYSAFSGQIGNGAEPGYDPPDFHEVLRQVGAHPHLMRRLGLVFDLEFTLPATPPSEIQVRTNWPSFGSTRSAYEDHRQVPMRMEVDANFEPFVANGAYRSARWLSLATPVYSVTVGNVVASGQAMGALQRNLANAPVASSPVEVPAVDESGYTVAHSQVVTMLGQVFDRQRVIEDAVDAWITSTPPAVLPPLIRAEDANAGTRWDVRDVAKGTFRSLHERRMTDDYDFPRDASISDRAPADEGWTSIAVSTDGTYAPAPKSTPVVYDDAIPKGEERDSTQWRVDGSVMRWSGWSLSAPRPGQILDAAGNPIARPPQSPQAGDPAQVGVAYEARPGTLERLRFNRSYQFRGRCVDLAGNSLPVAATAPASALSPAVLFGRSAPVPAPTVVRRSSRPDPGVGDLPDVVVIKSELTQTDASTPASDRMLFVPRINQLRLERHGLPAADGIDAADYAFLADRDARSLASQLQVDPETGELVAGAAVVGGAVTAGPYRQVARYLADPAARRVAFHGLPRGSAATPVTMETGTWPDPECVTLELRAGAAAPTVDAATRRVVVQLPKGTIHVCEVSSGIDTVLLDHFSWFQQLSSADKTRLRTAFLNGQVRVVSPRRTITLVHAVRVPLAAPSLGTFTPSRTTEGQTTVSLAGAVALHRATSERVVLNAAWDGPDFDVATVRQQRSAVLDDRFLPTTGSATSEAYAGLLFDLGDTRRVRMTVDAEAFCRFSSYFTERREWVVTQGNAFAADSRGLSAASTVVTDAASGQVYTEGADYLVNRVSGVVTALVGGAIPNGTTARVEYVPLPVSRVSAQATTGRTGSFTVPSSARPPVPKVSHVLPAFARSVRVTASAITVTHDGRVLRVFLERPWNESGDGELLGVATDLASVTVPVLTGWGRDPLNVGAGAKVRPGPASFRKAVATAPAIDGRFDVAGHRPVLDAARDLWTADVSVDARFGYRPFVQLHLCRYQPDSIAGMHVSDTVATETLRLGAQRTVTFTKRAGRRVEVRLTGPDRTNRVTVRLQHADPTIADPDLRWFDVSDPIVLARSGTTAASVHRGTISTPAASVPRRLLVEDAETVQREVDGVLVAGSEIAYREVVDLPTSW
jgi:hypothetical protein